MTRSASDSKNAEACAGMNADKGKLVVVDDDFSSLSSGVDANAATKKEEVKETAQRHAARKQNNTVLQRLRLTLGMVHHVVLMMLMILMLFLIGYWLPKLYNLFSLICSFLAPVSPSLHAVVFLTTFVMLRFLFACPVRSHKQLGKQPLRLLLSMRASSACTPPSAALSTMSNDLSPVWRYRDPRVNMPVSVPTV
eukprot:2995993-Amphidinium_carterae.1